MYHHLYILYIYHIWRQAIKEIFCYKRVSFFRNVDTKYRFVNWLNCNPYPNMFATCLNHGLINDKGRNSLPSVKRARIKSLNPIPYRQIASFLISKNCYCFRCISKAETKKIQIQRIHNYNCGCSVSNKS